MRASSHGVIAVKVAEEEEEGEGRQEGRGRKAAGGQEEET